MKITKIDVMILKPNQKNTGGGVKIDWANFDRNCRPIVCRIHTDEGIYGDGEAGMLFGVGALGTAGMMRDFARMIIGMDPLDNEVIWDKFYKQGYFTQSGGPIIYAAISAFDMALWDIKGKYFKVPIAKLLGGSRRKELRCYASQLQFGWGPELTPAFQTQDYVNNALKAVSEGYNAIKIDFFTLDKDGSGFTEEQRCGLLEPYYVDLVEERVAAVREAIGPKVDLIVEGHSFTDALSAVQIGERIKQYNIFYYEEACTPTPKMQKYVADALGIPMGSGERIFSRWQYAPYIENLSLQVLQPDLSNCGGITEAKKIADMAYIYDIGIQSHVCGTALTLAASLNFESVIPNFIIHEHHVVQFRQYMKELCTVDFEPENGKFKVPDGIGLGTELSEFALTHCEKWTIE
ncbi:MAG: mandelate racemase/muconate lactonizing enzyme family protein [Eubacteriaceae bacterium]|nr:mandelate racemase/muconate lactonizing enzyme family protein [Eubacteriaceae bacterium]